MVPMIHKKPAIISYILILLGFTALGSSSAGVVLGPVDGGKLADGVYEGIHRAGPNKAVVKVTVQEGKIVEIEIVKHRAWRGKRAESIIPRRIIERQSTKVDAVTGATNSSRVIMKAAQKAIEKAYQR
jgi:uncharacterized protein with FMN-binding domain